MIQANELRIGNKLYNENVIVTIDARSIFDIWDDKGLKKYSPVPLTEDILLKCGADRWEIDENNIRFDFEKYRFGYFDFYKNELIVTFQSQQISEKIKYLHQLQNLYFALTGEELTINL